MTVGSSGLWVRFLVHMTPPLSDIRTIFDDISDVFIEDVFRPATGIMNLLDPPQSGGLAAPTLWPDLRESPADNDPIVTNSPKGTFLMISNDTGWSTDGASRPDARP